MRIIFPGFMLRRFGGVCLVLALVGGWPGSAAAAPPPGRYVIIAEQSTVSAFVRSTFHDFNTAARKFRGEIILPPHATSKDVHIRLEFPTRELLTGNSWRDSILHSDTLDVEKHPLAIFESQEVRLESEKDGQTRYRVIGQFSLHGITRKITIPVLVRKNDARWFLATGKFQIHLSDYKLSPPSLLFISVEDRVDVRVKFTFRPLVKPFPKRM